MRRKRTRSTSSSDEQRSILLTNLNSSNQGRRRRTRSTSSPDQQMSILPTPEPQAQYTPKALSEPTEANKDAPKPQLENPPLTNNIDHIINQIRSELYEELRSPLVESEYWDETHSWNTNHETESNDYWHFVGRFE